MTMYARVLNFSDSAKVQVMGRGLAGKFQEVSEKTLEINEVTTALLYKGQYVFIPGPTTVAIQRDGGGADVVLKVEVQERDDDGRFVREVEEKAVVVGNQRFWVFSIRKGQQLQIHEKNVAAT